MLYFDDQRDERLAIKAGVQLAVSRYRDTYHKFVQSKKERLALIDEEITRLAHECAAATEADPIKVESRFRAVLGEEVSLSKLIDIETPIGGEEGKKYQDTKEIQQPEKGHSTTTVDELPEEMRKRYPEKDHRLEPSVTCFRCAGLQRESKAADGSIYCESCNHYVLTGEELEKEAVAPFAPTGQPVAPTGQPQTQHQPQPVNCPYCGTLMQQIGQTGQQQCPNCGANVVTQPGMAPQQGTQPQQPQAKTAQGEDDPPLGGEGDSAQAQSPAEDDPEDKQLPPAVEQTGNTTADLYTSIVQQLADANAAISWSTADDQDIQDISDAYGVDPDTVRGSLKVITDFGDSVAVNGDPDGDPSDEGFTELNQFGGRIPTTEQEVDVDAAVNATADRVGMTSDDVFTIVQDAYGADLGNQQFVSVSGEAHFYLPEEIVGQEQPPPPVPDEQQQQEQPAAPQQQYPAQSSVTPTRFKSLEEFLRWDRARGKTLSGR